MNNTFDTKRFGLLLRHDLRQCLPTYGVVGSLLFASLLFTPMLVLIRLATGDTTGNSYRLAMMVSMSAFYATQIPLYLYPNVGKKKKGTYAALLPASKGEKYLSMAALSLVILPVAMLAANLLLDTLFTTLHLPGYKHYLWQAQLLGWLDAPSLCNCLLAVAGPVLGCLYVNFVQAKGWRTTLIIILDVWLIGGLLGLPTAQYLTQESVLMWGVAALQLALTLLLAYLGWEKMKNASY